MSRYTVAAIPTAYAGVTFRSRLEARWAAMYDRLGWNWSYEPFDCAGWIPDFALSSRDETGSSTRPILVEIKPIAAFDSVTAAKIDDAEREHEVLLAGYTLPVWNGRVTVGWLRDTGMEWAPAPIGRWTGVVAGVNDGGVAGFCHGANSFVDRITGCDDGPCFGGGRIGPLALDAMWRDAGNKVQWRPERDDGPVTVVEAVDPDAEVSAFVDRRPDWRHLSDADLALLVEQEDQPAARKELIAALLSAGQITFGQARRQVVSRPELAGA